MHRCCLCPEHHAVVDLHHVVAISEDGPNTEENLMAVCPTCHATIHRIRNRYTIDQLRMYKERWVRLCALGLPLDVRIAHSFDYTQPPKSAQMPPGTPAPPTSHIAHPVPAQEHTGREEERNLVARVVEWYGTWRRRRRTPSKGDKPIAVLRQLHRQGLGLELARVDVKIEDEVQRGYLLEPRDEDQKSIWIGPTIVVEWLAGADEALQMEVEEQLWAKGSPLALARLLEQGRARGELRVRWKPMGQLTGPREVRVAEIERYFEPTVIVEQE
jgi:hypothetical protein